MSSAVATRGTLLRMATAGSVDDGKSTLVGRLLHDTKSVLADQFAVLPPAIRVDPMTVAFDCATMAEVIGWMTALSAMSFAVR